MAVVYQDGGRLGGVSVYGETQYRSQRNGDVFVPFRPVETEVKRPFPYTTMETGRTKADGTEHAIDYHS